MNTTIYLNKPTKVPVTKLPESVVLTELETIQLCELEKMFYTVIKEDRQSEGSRTEAFDISHTTNIGIYYFCLENNFELRSIACNRNISIEIANAIFDKALNLNIAMETSISYLLIWNRVVCTNLELFKKVFKKMKIDDSFIRMALGLIVTDASIEVLLFMLNAVKNSSTKSSSLYSSFFDSLKPREEEITQWLQENNPVLVGLPLTWVLKAYDIHD